jgi:hypothetical protein
MIPDGSWVPFALLHCRIGATDHNLTTAPSAILPLFSGVSGTAVANVNSKPNHFAPAGVAARGGTRQHFGLTPGNPPRGPRGGRGVEKVVGRDHAGIGEVVGEIDSRAGDELATLGLAVP